MFIHARGDKIKMTFKNNTVFNTAWFNNDHPNYLDNDFGTYRDGPDAQDVPLAQDAPKLVITESCKSRRNTGSVFIRVTPLASEATARILN